MLYYGCAQVNEYKINIEYPHGYRANDAFFHPALARYIKDVGNFMYNPPYAAYGYNDTIHWYPPLLPYLTAQFSFLTGIDPYNLIIFMLVLLTTFASLIMYFIIKHFNKSVALLSLPLMPFLFYKNFYVGFTWGQSGFIMGSFFFLAIFWVFTKLALKYSFVLLGLFLTGAALAHTSEFILAIGFIVFYFFVEIVTKQFRITELKTAIVASIIFAVLSVYYLIIFKYDRVANSGVELKFGSVTQTTAFLIGKFSDFGWLMPVIIIGIIFALVLLFVQKKSSVALIVGIYMLLLGFTNYVIVGLAHFAFQTRFFWPVYLSGFFGLTLYQISQVTYKKMNNTIFALISIGCIFLLMFTVYEKNSPDGLMDSSLWQAFTWIRDHTQKEDNLYFFYGDRYQQSGILLATERNAWKVNPQDYISALQNKTIKRFYISDINQVDMYVRRGIFTFEHRNPTDPLQDICSFNYYVFDKISQYPPLIQYNQIIENMFLNLGWMETVYSSSLLDIVKNNKPGVNCVVFQNKTVE